MKRLAPVPVLGAGLALLVLLLVPGCLDENVVEPGPVPIERLNPVGAGTYSGIAEPAREVVRDAVTFEALWKKAWTSVPPPPVPEVDFGTHVVLVVALGERSTGGYSVEVAEVVSEGYGLRATVRSTSPGKGCPVSMASTQPVEFVGVPARGEAIRFAEEHEVTDCD